MSHCRSSQFNSVFSNSLSAHVKKIKRHFFSCNETPLCTGSLTLEAAIVFPLLTGFIVFCLFFFRVLQIQASVQKALLYASRKAAATAGSLDSEESLLLAAKGFLVSQLSDDAQVENYVVGGLWGVSLLTSDLSGENIDLVANYYIDFPLDFFEFKGMQVSQEAVCHKWIGSAGLTEETDPYVYVTKEGTVYHRSLSCNYLDLTIEEIAYTDLVDERNYSGHKYYACEACIDDNYEDTNVYITTYGQTYHINLDCIGLKRTINMVRLSEVGNKSPCNKCGGSK